MAREYRGCRDGHTHTRAERPRPGLSGAEGGGRVAAEDLAVGAAGLGGAVGVQDELPAPAVDADVVVELAQQHAAAGAGGAAVFLWVMWCTSHQAAGRPQRGQAHRRSRSSTARRMCAGMVSE